MLKLCSIHANPPSGRIRPLYDAAEVQETITVSIKCLGNESAHERMMQARLELETLLSSYSFMKVVPDIVCALEQTYNHHRRAQFHSRSSSVRFRALAQGDVVVELLRSCAMRSRWKAQPRHYLRKTHIHTCCSFCSVRLFDHTLPKIAAALHKSIRSYLRN